MSGSAQPAGDSGPDVVQLAAESLKKSPFPVARSVPFRVHFEPQAYAGMTAHAREETSVEICGVLVGDWGRDDDGAFVTVQNFVRCDSAAKKFAEVTFTHDSWAHINREMDTKFQNQRIVGWYHSHPNFGIFLSDRDMFIQQNFFSGPGQVALVIDPVRKIEGVFEWHGGKAIPTAHYWVGSKVQLAPVDSDVTGMPEGPLDAIPVDERSAYATAEYAPLASSRHSTLNTFLMLTAALGLFLAGWVLAGSRSLAERRALVEGTVAHFGIWGLLKPGLEDELYGVERELIVVADQLKALSTSHQKLADAGGEKADAKAGDDARLEWKKAFESTADVQQHVRHIQRLYSLTPEERQMIRMIIEQKLVELSRGIPTSPSPDGSDTATTSDRRTDEKPREQPATTSAEPDKSKTAKPK